MGNVENLSASKLHVPMGDDASSMSDVSNISRFQNSNNYYQLVSSSRLLWSSIKDYNFKELTSHFLRHLGRKSTTHPPTSPNHCQNIWEFQILDTRYGVVISFCHFSFSQTSNKTFVTEESSLVLETLEEGRHHHYLIPIQVIINNNNKNNTFHNINNIIV